MLRFLELESCGQISGPMAASAKPPLAASAKPLLLHAPGHPDSVGRGRATGCFGHAALILLLFLRSQLLVQLDDAADPWH